MTMVIGTRTGKTFAVHALLTEDRIITTRGEEVEYWDEKRTDAYIKRLDEEECDNMQARVLK